MAAQDSFTIHLPVFEGPFDLLLFFIERDELDIYDIPISRITDQFLDYLKSMQAMNMDLAGEFILVAATLMRIKARMLLPVSSSGEEEGMDPREELVQRLIAYKQFKEVSQELERLHQARALLYNRGNGHLDQKVMAGLDKGEEELHLLDLYQLMRAYARVLQKFERSQDTTRHEVERYPYTVEEQKVLLQKLLDMNQKMHFDHLVQHTRDKVQLVYMFLAMLEMLQQQLLEIQTGLGYNNFWVSASSTR